MRDVFSRQRLSRLSVIVLFALAAVAVAMWVVTTEVVRNQDRKLLHERTKEVASVFSTEISNAQSSLALLAGVPSRSRGSATAFASAAGPLLKQGVAAVGVAGERGGRPTVIAAVGSGPPVGYRLSGGLALLVGSALASKNLDAALLHQPTGDRLSVAAPGPGGAVAYEESVVDPARPTPAPAGSPFSDLNVIAYAAPRASPSALILTTVSRPSQADGFERMLVPVGATRWLLLTSSRDPLVGSFAASMPSVVLGIGLLSALLVTSLVEVLARRRRYALGLVDQRTEELQRALDQQVRLEQDQRVARDIADAANRAKSEFLSRMSHELRTPLNAVIGFGQLLEMDSLDGRSREHVQHILKGGRHLLELINEVLELSRIEAGELHISPEPVPLQETVREAVSLVQPLAAKRDIDVSADMSGLASDGHVYADRQRLKQVLLNLLSNAIKYNKDGGEVTVSFARTDAERIRIIVADTGIGIPPDRFSGVFEPFERLGAETSDVQGTGLGLALSRRIVEAMGGSISFESQIGQGTTFTVEFACVEAPSDAAATTRNGEAINGVIEAPGAKPHRILYIEDNLSNLTLVTHILERQVAVDLVPAMQGTLGIELAREHQPDLIILDLHLPDMPGDQVLRRLKADPVTSSIPVIVLSADAGKRQATRLMDAGAAEYLTKPLDVPLFLNAVAEQLAAGPATSQAHQATTGPSTVTATRLPTS